MSIRAMVFDPHLFVDDKSTPISYTIRPATIVKYRYDSFGRKLADVIFDHRPEDVSHGHFVDGITYI